MIRRPLLIALAGMLLGVTVAAACGSDPSHNFVCCFDVNGQKSYWSCPNQTAFAQCCGNGSNGCLDGNPGSCTDNADPNDCN